MGILLFLVRLPQVVRPVHSADLLLVIPSLESLMKRGSGERVLDYDTLAEAAVIRLDRAEGYTPHPLYWDDGSLISILTGADVDPHNKVLIAGGLVSESFLVCDISDDKTGVKFE